jgi:hypothetical protein
MLRHRGLNAPRPRQGDTSHRFSSSLRLEAIWKMKGKTIGIAVLLAMVAVGLGWWLSIGRKAARATDAAKHLVMLREAMANLDGAEPDRAIEVLKQLQQAYPDDVSLATNLAIAEVVRLDSLQSRIEAGELPEQPAGASAPGGAEPPMRLQEAEARLPSALESTRGAVSALEQRPERSLAHALILTYFERIERRRLPEVMQRDEKGRALRRLLAYLKQHPQATVLVESINELAMSMDDSELNRQRLEAIIAASDGNPTNLSVVRDAVSGAIEARSPEAPRLATRMATLVRPLAFELDLQLKPLRADDVMQEGIKFLEAGRFEDAEAKVSDIASLVLGIPAFKADVRRSDAHPLDFLDDTLEQQLVAALDVARPEAQAASVNGSIRRDPLLDNAKALAWVNFDLVGGMELATIDDQKLTVVGVDQDGRWTVIAQQSIAQGATTVQAVDLFVVDGGSPQRIKRQKVPLSESTWFDTFQSILVAGDAGIEIFQINPGAASAADRLVAWKTPTGLEAIRGVRRILPIDVESDGDLDLIIESSDQASSLSLWINRGSMNFFSATQYSEFPKAGTTIADWMAADLDRDQDMDVVMADANGTIGMLENNLHLQFRWRPLDWPELRGTSLAVCELDGKPSWDVIAGDEQGWHAALTKTPSMGQIVASRSMSKAQAGSGVRAEDFNNDGRLDVLRWGTGGATLSVQTQDGAWGEPSTLSKDPVLYCAIDDLNRDGKLDVAMIDGVGGAVWINQTNGGDSVTVEIRGIDDNAVRSGRNNHFAVGSTVELRTNDRYQARIVDRPMTHFGIDPTSQPVALRVIFPNGLTQSITSPAENVLLHEQQESKGSCPYLYGWDGEKFAFITDCLWAAPLGLQSMRGVMTPDRPWEYLKIDGEAIKPKDGAYELRITEELWEITYLDHVALQVVDHPADIDIFTNEKVGPPFIATPMIHVVKDRQPVVSARLDDQSDVTERIAKRDEQYLVPYDAYLCKGLALPHGVELDLGPDAAKAKQVLLVLTGWIYPTDTSLNIKIDQHPHWPRMMLPRIEIPDGQGGWRVAKDPMGFPGGKTKSMVVDISDVIDRNDPRVRLATTAMIHWDAIELAIDPPQTQLQIHDARLIAASLDQHGYSTTMPRVDSQPHRYDYDDSWKGPRWVPLEGPLTGFGDCREALIAHDDRMIVFAGGDEVRLRFAAPEVPLPAGWKRDFVLHNVGWDKDADINTLTGQSTLPLPFQSMSAYPPPHRQRAEAQRVWELNRSTLTRQQPFDAFWSDQFPVLSLDGARQRP